MRINGLDELHHAIKTSLDAADNTDTVVFDADDIDAFIYALNAHGFEIIKKGKNYGN